MGYGARQAWRKAVFALLVAANPATAQEITIAALGDSLTAGFGLPQGEGFVPQLQDWLNDRGHNVSIRNAGVSGDTTAGGLARVGWTLEPEIDAMIVALGGNDILRGLPPGAARENLAAILTTARDQDVEVLLAGLEAPLNFGPAYKQEFDTIYPTLAAEFDVLLVANFLAGLQEALDAGTSPELLLQADGIHPTAAGIALMVDAIGPSVETLIDRVD
ncbi:MAG: arylesterase [Pseudomonadota bacterium]